MIRTWLSDIRPLYEEQRYRKYYDTLPAFRKEKADRLRSKRTGAERRSLDIAGKDTKEIQNYRKSSI